MFGTAEYSAEYQHFLQVRYSAEHFKYSAITFQYILKTQTSKSSVPFFFK